MKKYMVYLCAFMALFVLGGYSGKLVNAAAPIGTQDNTIETRYTPPQPQILDESVVSEWASAYITKAHSLGLVPHSLFAVSPTATDYTLPITRAEFAALAVTLYETVTGAEVMGRTSFSDTTDIYVEKIAYLNVVFGVGNNHFDPYSQLTREQAAVILVRLFFAIHAYLDTDLPTMLDLPHLADIFTDYEQVSPWAFDGVASAFVLGIMGGVGDGTFDPISQYTREQSIVTILRLFDMMDE